MKAVKRTKNPSVQQMLNMSTNLRDKFKSHAAIELRVAAYSHGDDKVEYWVYVADHYSEHLPTWQAVLDTYKELMNA